MSNYYSEMTAPIFRAPIETQYRVGDAVIVNGTPQKVVAANAAYVRVADEAGIVTQFGRNQVCYKYVGGSTVYQISI